MPPGRPALRSAILVERADRTQSFVLILHDPDPVVGGSSRDVLHWAIFDIPGSSTGLPEGVAKGDQSDGAKQIKNIAEPTATWDRARLPATAIITTLALYAKLGVPESTSRAELMKAMDGKVVSKGVYIGIFAR